MGREEQTRRDVAQLACELLQATPDDRCVRGCVRAMLLAESKCEAHGLGDLVRDA